MIELTQLSVKVPGRTLVENLNIQVNAGEIVAVLGPNGRGKTTLLKTILNLLPAAQGHVALGGHAAYVPQQNDALFAYDVITIVVMGRARHLPWYGSPGPQDVAIAEQALDAVGMRHLAHRPYRLLSGGERQLVSMARAIASESQIMLLDEPAAALDLFNQNIILTVMKNLAKAHNMAVMFTTHHPQHAQHIADQTLMMYRDGCEVGLTAEICTDAALSRLYGIAVKAISVQDAGREYQGVMPMFD
jgi:iron complex transport system ATP-binding protein